MPYKKGRRKKRHTEKKIEVSEQELKETPRCLVVRRGVVGSRVRALVQDFREVMLPNCAKKLKERRSNRIEDFVSVAGVLHLSHLIMFTASKRYTWMKLVKLPQGPTLTFQVESFTLAREVRASQRHPQSGPRDLLVAPLQVISGFAGQDEADKQRLTAEMLRGLFPPIDVPNFNQAEVRRAVLFHHEGEKDTIQFRHFCVGRRTVGLQRGISKLLRTTRIPKLGRCGDVADFVLGGGVGASESEMEDLQEVPISGSRDRVAVKLVETGPRLTLLLVKAEEGVCNGAVLYHRYQTKLPSQIQVLQEKAEQRRKLKARAAYLDSKAEGQKSLRLELKKRKKAAEEEEDDGGLEEGKLPTNGKAGAADSSAKKKRFHPFGWGAKTAKHNSSRSTADGGRRTVDFNSQPGASGDPGKHQAQQRVLDRFHRASQRP